MTVFRVSNSVLMPLGYASLGGNKMALFARIVKSAEGMEVNIKVGAGTLFLAAVGVAAVCTKVGPMTMQIARDPESRRELLQWCRGRSKFRPLHRRKMQASSTGGSRGQKVLNDCLVWDFSGTRSGPVTAAVAGFSSVAWPKFEPPHTSGYPDRRQTH
jgi:hypothetical protein